MHPIVYAVAAVTIAAGNAVLSPANRDLAAAFRPCASPKASAPVPAPSESQARKVFELTLKGGKVAGTANTIKARRGDQLELRWSSDRPITLHLHGYDIETKVAPDAPAAMIFKANVAGRFPVSEHRQGPGHHRAVLYLEVHP